MVCAVCVHLRQLHFSLVLILPFLVWHGMVSYLCAYFLFTSVMHFSFCRVCDVTLFTHLFTVSRIAHWNISHIHQTKTHIKHLHFQCFSCLLSESCCCRQSRMRLCVYAHNSKHGVALWTSEYVLWIEILCNWRFFFSIYMHIMC